MKAFVQRTQGVVKLRVDGADAGGFDGAGLVVLLGWQKTDESRADLETAEEWIRTRVEGLRIFPDTEGRMNLSLDAYLRDSSKGGILWVSQFTLGAKLESGFRPSFIEAMDPRLAHQRFEKFMLRCQGPDRQDSGQRASQKISYVFGTFGANMDLSFTNWGPVTIPLER